MSADWRVGQKICCVVGPDFWRMPTWELWWDNLRAGVRDPRKGAVYEISRIRVKNSICGGVGLGLVGMHQGWIYSANGFRPVVEFKNDISELQAILNRLDQPLPIDA